MEGILVELFERDHNTIERQKIELERIHQSSYELITRTSEATGIDPEMLLHIANRTSQRLGDSMPWYRVLETVNTFFMMKNHVESLLTHNLPTSSEKSSR